MSNEKQLDNKYMVFYLDKNGNPENSDTYNELQELLKKVGVSLIWDNDNYIATVGILSDRYTKVLTRGAGRKNKQALYKYSDVIHFLHKTDTKTVKELLNMSNGTYYRHYKRMTDSEYYKSIDQSRIDDLEYLRSIAGDKLF